MVRIGLCLLLLCLSACSSSKEEYDRGPQGRSYELRCKYALKPCYYKARERCLNKYKIINQYQTNRTGGPRGRYKEYVMNIVCE